MLWIVLSVLHALNPRDCYTNLPKALDQCIGDTITITPEFVGYPSTPELDWTNVGGDKRVRVMSNGTMIITNAQESDSELYSYLVHSEDEFTMSFFNLTVKDCRVEPTRVRPTVNPTPSVVVATTSTQILTTPAVFTTATPTLPRELGTSTLEPREKSETMGSATIQPTRSGGPIVGRYNAGRTFCWSHILLVKNFAGHTFCWSHILLLTHLAAHTSWVVFLVLGK